MSHKKSILFRISGGRAKNKELGLGHIYRAMNLSMNLQDYQIHFLVEDYGGALNVLKKNKKKHIHRLKNNADLNEDIEATCTIIDREKIDLLIVDKFDKVTKSYVTKMKKFIKTQEKNILS